VPRAAAKAKAAVKAAPEAAAPGFPDLEGSFAEGGRRQGGEGGGAVGGTLGTPLAQRREHALHLLGRERSRDAEGDGEPEGELGVEEWHRRPRNLTTFEL
jgi:hypothetical protein